jgi:alkylation response protein AidB-like acyl-CoA dehydrogenase
MIATFSEHHRKLQQTVRKVAQERVVPRAAEIDATDEYPYDLRKLFAELGYFSILVPKEYGGQGGDITSACIIHEEIAKVSASCAQMTYSAMHACCMLLFGSDEQRARLYPAIASGEKIFGLSATEPDVGSDISGIKTTAVLNGDHYIVNGTKTFASGAGFWNGWFTLIKTDPTKGVHGLSIFLIETDSPGVHLSRDDRLGLRGGGGGEVILDNALIPKENLIGREEEARPILGEYLPLARIGHAAVALGIAEGALDCTINYVKSRFRLERLITTLEEVQQLLAELVVRAETAHSMLYQVTALADRDYKDPGLDKYGSMARYYCGEAAMRNTTDAVQLLGGDSYSKDFPVERMMRDAKAYQILEGTQQVQRLIIARNVLRS